MSGISQESVRRWGTFATVSVVPTTVDVGLLVVLRQRYGWPLLVADLLAIAVASAVSYTLHRVATFRSHPFFRWVRHPGAFVGIALPAALIDASLLRLIFTAAGYTSVGGLLLAKAMSLGVAVAVRAAGYRFVLAEEIRHTRTKPEDPQPLVDGSCRLSIVVPAYHEVDRIGDTVTRIRRELADIDAEGGVEVIVVDDGSADGTADAALAAGATNAIALPRNRGKGGAVRAGMLASHGRVVAFTDADLAYDPAHLRALLHEAEHGWDVVIGNRHHPDSCVERSSGLRAVGSHIVNRLSAAVLLAAPRDTQCGLKAFRCDVARAIFARTRIDGFAFDIEVLHLVERNEWSLQEIPVRLDESGDSSTVRPMRDVIRLSMDLARVRRWATLGAYDGPARHAPRMRVGS